MPPSPPPRRRRGFEMRGVGPASDGDAVGGTAYWAAGLHLYSPLPLRPHWGGIGDLFRTHAFLTAGNIGDFAAPGQCHSHAHVCKVIIFSDSVPPSSCAWLQYILDVPTQ